MVPKKNSVGGMSPRELYTGVKTDYLRECKIGFGEYVQVYNDDDTTNSMRERTRGAISLGTSGNLQGTYLFMDLITWKVIKRRAWTVLPMPVEVINQLNSKAKHENPDLQEVNQEDLNNRGINHENNLPYIPYVPDIREFPEQANQPEPQLIPIEEYVDQNQEILGPQDNILPPNVQNGGQDIDYPVPYQPIHDHEYQLNDFEQQNINEDRQVRDENNEFQAIPRYNLRPRKSNWRQRYGDEYINAVTLTNLSIKKAVKQFGSEAAVAIMKEMDQMHTKQVWTPMSYEDIKKINNGKYIRSLLFLKRKRDGTLKARLVADGSMQDRSTATNISSPTVAIESLFTLAAMFKSENRNIFTIDIEGAYLHGVMTNTVIMELSGHCVDILVYMYPTKYNNLVSNNKLYVKLDKALYGTIEAAKIWYDTLSKVLKNDGYIENKRDVCVFNKLEDGKTLTIAIHVDDLFVGSQLEDGVIRVSKMLQRAHFKPNIYSSDNVDYLGMIFKTNLPHGIEVSMENMVQDLVNSYGSSFGLDDGTVASTPAGSNLFTIDDDLPVLESTDRERFHSLVAKALYMSKRARPDILTAVSFLTTRVQNPTNQDLKKLKRLIAYLNGTKELCLCINAQLPLTIHC
jgi:hypothetical protein